MQTATLPSVGTNPHTVAITFQGANIIVTYDGAQMISVTDNNFDFATPYKSGGISVDMFNDTNAFTLTVDNVSVSGASAMLREHRQQTVTATAFGGSSALNVTAPGVLGNDSGGNSARDGFAGDGVTHGTLNLNANGSFSYSPANGFVGTDSFTYSATDGNTASTGIVTITVTPPVTVRFSDDFTSSTDPGPLAPWVAQDGTWSVTGRKTDHAQRTVIWKNDADRDSTRTAVYSLAGANGRRPTPFPPATNMGTARG